MINKNFIIPILVGVGLWFYPIPEALSSQSWHLFAIFIATIVGIIMKPLPMGAIALLSICVCTVTNTLTLPQALKGFSSGAIWLVLIAFFIAKGLIKTNLGVRIAYYFVRMFGKRTIGLAYSLVLSEFLLAPAIPSFTARTGGIIYPIVSGLAQAFDSKPHDPSAKKLGCYLILATFQCSVVLSGMFITAMAGNPLVASLAADLGVNISWGQWALAGIVPGLASIIIIPYAIYIISPPKIKETPNAKTLANKKLTELGSIKTSEIIMLGVFILLLVLWVFGENFGIDSVVTAFIGLSILLVTNVLNWEDVLEEKAAWNTFIWFATLVTLGLALNEHGIITFFSKELGSMVSDMHWSYGLGILALIYFYTHYFFASNTAHIGAMYSVFLAVAMSLGAPAMMAALLLAFISNLFGGLTHYGCSPAPILYGSGYVRMKEWWTVGFFASIINVIIWGTIGVAWWKFLGYW